MPEPRDLFLCTPHKSGPDVKALQPALNKRLRARGFDPIGVDGDYGADTATAVRRVGYMLGALESTLAEGAPVGLQQMILDPDCRNKAQLARAAARAKELAERGDVVDRVLAWCESKIGMTESPAGSNRGPEIDRWQKEFGLSGDFWCGAFVGYPLRKVAAIPLPRSVVYTPSIISLAKTRTGGFEGWHPWSERARGDLVLFKFPGVSRDPCDHVGIYAGQDLTIEGNTCKGDGSQNNGGGVYKRKRPPGEIVGCARPRYQ
jgi:hypothetical protein